ncbi:general substrate transporter [Cucurbitaria berberidis CBS 394.84]|uniref:General substrate transporter n=1 Tax=Cucurbitaria berberidis CBS 394.84 TaxID=1168544 RepID=A0A9P4GQW3_9PLEO|nr:general substrate transporter [Cucurbitaria berberidis CBS 394.84]KAF1850050.1 general substrate transporter [Cucurbitaria berberidis CBS 394.84]
MGHSKSNDAHTELAVGRDLLAALPVDRKPWYRTKHMIQLNLILLVPLFASATTGFDGAMMNGLQTVEQWRSYFGTPSSSILGVINAVYPIGTILGVLPTAYLSDRYGRRVPLIFGLVLCIVGAAIQGAAQNLAMFIVARCILGFATAHIAQPSPIIITELAYPIHRGKITALYNTFYYAGAVFAAWSTYGSFPIQSTWSWRIPSILQGAFPTIQLVFIYFLPESPRWLVANDRAGEARALLVKYHAGGDSSSALVDYEMREMEGTIRLETETKTSYMDLLNTAPNRRRTLIAALVGFFSQWNGVGVVSYYLTLVLNNIGITKTSDQALINGLLQVFNWIVSVVGGALLVDRLGRRTLFLVSAAGMLVSYIIWTILTSTFTRTLDDQTGRAVVAFIFIYYFFYDIAWTPLLQAYCVEIFPYTLRGRGLSVTLGSAYVGLIIGQFVNPIAMEHLKWRYYIVFCCLLALLLFLTWFLFPETRGRTLEQIAEVFEGRQDDREAVGEKVMGERNEKSAVEHVNQKVDSK